MTMFVRFDESGNVEQVLQAPAAPEASWYRVVNVAGAAAPYGLAVDEVGVVGAVALHDLARMRLNGALVEARPASPQPYVVGNRIHIPASPAGTRITIFDIIGEEEMGTLTVPHDGWSDDIGFSDPGTYTVEVEAPDPYMPSMARITLV